MTNYQCKKLSPLVVGNIGDYCVECLQSTAFGSGRFVNRIPADRDIEDEEGNVTKNVPDRSKAGKRFHSGFIAQDVKATMDSFGVDFGVYRDKEISAEEVHRERAKDKLSLCYREFIAIQTKAIQELSSKVSLLEAEIEILKG